MAGQLAGIGPTYGWINAVKYVHTCSDGCGGIKVIRYLDCLQWNIPAGENLGLTVKQTPAIRFMDGWESGLSKR